MLVILHQYIDRSIAEEQIKLVPNLFTSNYISYISHLFLLQTFWSSKTCNELWWIISLNINHMVVILWFPTTRAISASTPLMLWVRTPLRRDVLDTTLCHKACQLSVTCDRSVDLISLITPISSTNKTDRHDIILKYCWK